MAYNPQYGRGTSGPYNNISSNHFPPPGAYTYGNLPGQVPINYSTLPGQVLIDYSPRRCVHLNRAPHDPSRDSSGRHASPRASRPSSISLPYRSTKRADEPQAQTRHTSDPHRSDRRSSQHVPKQGPPPRYQTDDLRTKPPPRYKTKDSADYLLPGYASKDPYSRGNSSIPDILPPGHVRVQSPIQVPGSTSPNPKRPTDASKRNDRRSSPKQQQHSGGATRASSDQTGPRPEKTAKSLARPREVTPADLNRESIPEGYDSTQWDPDEEPILLLGSVFDAKSLGKWIYDWVVHYYGPGSRWPEVACELCRLLIEFASKTKRLKKFYELTKTDSHEVLDDFFNSSVNLGNSLSELLKICAEAMGRVFEKYDGPSPERDVAIGHKCVETMFNDQQKFTAKLMKGISTWSWRFDANCPEVLTIHGV